MINGFRLVTGEVVLAENLEETVDFFKVKNPAALVTQEIEPGRIGVALQPFVPFSTGVIDLYKYSINAVFELDQQVVNEYNRIYGSGIVIAGANEVPNIQV